MLKLSEVNNSEALVPSVRGLKYKKGRAVKLDKRFDAFGPVYAKTFSNENGTKSCRIGLSFTLKRFRNRHQMKTILKTVLKGRQIIPLPLFESVTIPFLFQAFTLIRFMPFSNHSVFRIVSILFRLRKRDFVPFGSVSGAER